MRGAKKKRYITMVSADADQKYEIFETGGNKF